MLSQRFQIICFIMVENNVTGFCRPEFEIDLSFFFSYVNKAVVFKMITVYLKQYSLNFENTAP